MKRLLTGALALLLSIAASATTLNPVQLLNPTGSASGQAIVSTGASTAPAWGGVGVNGIAPIAANTVLANGTGSSASPTAYAMPSCSGNTNAVTWLSGTGFGCNSAINAATLGGATFASPGAIGGTTPNAGTFTTLKGNSLAKVFATNTSGQSIPNNAATTVTGWTTVRDANSNFVASTGIFTAPATADYLVCGQLIIGGTGLSNGIVEMNISGNGTVVAIANSPVASTAVTDNTVSGCADVFISNAQTISIQILQNSGAAQNLGVTPKQLFLSIIQLP